MDLLCELDLSAPPAVDAFPTWALSIHVFLVGLTMSVLLNKCLLTHVSRLAEIVSFQVKGAAKSEDVVKGSVWSTL